MRNNKAQNAALVGGVLSIIVVATLLYVGNIITFKINAGMPASTTDATAVAANITANTNAAWSLGSVTPLVAGAILILSVILGFAAVVGARS